MTSSALDLPTGAQVTAGAASVQMPAKGALLVNQSTQRAVIKWSDFSIGQGKQVTFAQPNAGAATLNVVTGGNTSTIAGTLKSNGSVYLINQNGIAITPTGLVDTRAGFIASTLRMDEAAFMSGKNVFSGKGGSVVNRGQILTGPGGTVGLLGSTVSNEGLISAPLGKVALGSGEAATLDLSGDGFLQVMLPTSAVAADGQALVSNSGVIQADGGMVMLKAATVRQALREAVNMPGAISARSVSGKNGAIVLEGGAGGSVRVTGALIADGDTVGGRIDVTGANVTLEGASLSATGPERGGLVRVGGAFQGGREQPADSADAAIFAGRFGSTPAITNATTTSIDAASSINVSATGVAGTGGTAIVWSDSTTVMQGAIAARGALTGGAVEVSAKSTVQSVALKRIDLGKGGKLLIDPQDIVIDNVVPADAAGSYSYAAPGTITHLLDTDLTALLSTGATVSLQASQDISWLNNFSFVTRTPTTPGGDLNLSAGRSVTLSGIFTTADGNWTIVANDTAAHGVVDAQRGAGAALIDVRNATFINSNGNLSLTLSDGADNTNREVDGITLGKFNGNGLTAAISPTAIPAYGAARILLTDDINVSGAISLSGNLQVSSMNPVLSLSGQSVTWTDEKTGSTIRGEQNIKFIENGVTTRFGQLFGSDAVRLGLGDIPSNGLTRTYGENDLNIADILPSEAILSANSLEVTGPGVLAAAGSNHMTLSATNTLAFADGLSGGYFVDLTPATLPLTITQRTLTPTVSAGAYIYGSPTAVVSLAGMVNGDVLTPVATLNSTLGVAMANNGAGFGFAETAAAGLSRFSLTGLSGFQASNYTLDLSGAIGSTLDITRKPLTYVAQGGSHIYGSPNGLPLGVLSGIVARDDVSSQVSLSTAGVPAALATKLPVGTYTASVVALAGAEAGNYTIAASGNTDGQYQVTPKPLTYVVTNASGTYGTLASLGASDLYGVLAGDTVAAIASLKDAADNAVTQTATLAAGNYREIVSALNGAAAGNYQLAGNGNQEGTLAIARKQITYTGSDSTQTYGAAALPTPVLNGIVGTDRVTAQQSVTITQSQQQGGSGAVPVGEYRVDVASLSGAESANYTVVQPGSIPGHVLVTPKLLSYVHPTSSQVVYGDSAPDATLSGVVSGDLIQGVSSVSNAAGAQALVPTTDVGSYTRSIVGLSGTGAGNYALASSGNTNGNLDITPRSLTWQVGGGSAIYGDAITNYASLINLVPGDAVDVSKSALDGSGAAMERPGVGVHSVGVTSISGPRSANYVLASSGNTPGSVQITPRPVNYFYTGTQSVYGSDPNAYGADGVYLSRVNGVLASDINQVHAITTSPGYVLDANGNGQTLSNQTPVGSYSRIGGYVTGLDNPNYILGISLGSLNSTPYGSHYISKKQITITTSEKKSITYGDNYSPSLANLNGIMPGDDVHAKLDRSIPGGILPAGDYSIFASKLDGQSASNYSLIQEIAPLNLSVKQKFVNLYSTSPSGQLKYFGNEIANVVEYGTILDAYAGFSYNQPPVMVVGLVPGGEAGILIQPSKPIFKNSSSGALNAGTYSWNPAIFSSSNYIVANPGFGGKSLTVTPKPVIADVTYTPSASTSRTYGETSGMRPTVNVTWNSILQRDDIGVATAFSGLPQGQEALNERQNVGFYEINIQGAIGSDAKNYQVTFSPRSFGQGLTIEPRSVRATINSAEFVYGNSITAPKPTINILPGDSVTATTVVTSGATEIGLFGQGYRPDAGSYYLKLGPLSGSDASNYKAEGQQDASARAFNRPADELAILAIQKRFLTVVGKREDLSIIYGEKVNPTLSLSGVLLGDDVDTTPKARTASLVAVNGFASQWVGNGALIDIQSRLNAGDYILDFPLTGKQAKNYQLPLAAGNNISVSSLLSVAKRATTVADQNFEYGRTATPDIRFTNTLSGDQLLYSGAVYGKPNYLSGHQDQVSTGLLDAGQHEHTIQKMGEAPPTLSGPGSNNYYVANSSFKTLVSKKMLIWTPSSNQTSVYGDPIELGTLTGFEHKDIDIERESYAPVPLEFVVSGNKDPFWLNKLSSIQLKTIIRNSSAIDGVISLENASAKLNLLANSRYYSSGIATFYNTLNLSNPVKIIVSGYQTYTRYVPINIGEYSVFESGSSLLSGPGAQNYQLPENMQTTRWLITPRTVTYSIPHRTTQYGNYEGCNRFTCPFEMPAIPYATPFYNNVLVADRTGYLAQPDGNIAGRIKGAIENISLIDINGKKGTVNEFINSNTPVGTTFTEVLDSLISRNYVLASNGNSNGLLTIEPKRLIYTTTSGFFIKGIGMVGDPGKVTLQGIMHGQEVVPTIELTSPSGIINYGSNNVNPSSLNEGRYIFNVRALSGIDAANYLLPIRDDKKFSVIGTLDVFEDTRLGMRLMSVIPFTVAPPSLPLSTTNTAAANDTASVRSTGTATDSSRYGVKAQALAITTADSQVGGVEFVSSAQAEATAKCSYIGCKAEVNTGVKVEVELSDSEKLAIQAEVAAEASAGLSRKGLKAGVTAIATAGVGVEGERTIDGAGDLSYGASTNVVAGAQATAIAGYSDGKVGVSTGAQAGVGVTASTNVALAGEVGGVSASPSISSPGSFGGQFKFEPGYSDGVLSVSMNLGAQIGLGGLNLNIDLSLNLGSVADFFDTNKTPKWQKSRDIAESLSSDPLRQIAYLKSTGDWRGQWDVKERYQQKIDAYDALINEIPKALQASADLQNRILTLMTTNPAAAVELVRSQTKFNGMYNQYDAIGTENFSRVNELSSELGIGVIYKDGKMSLSNFIY